MFAYKVYECICFYFNNFFFPFFTAKPRFYSSHLLLITRTFAYLEVSTKLNRFLQGFTT